MGLPDADNIFKKFSNSRLDIEKAFEPFKSGANVRSIRNGLFSQAGQNSNSKIPKLVMEIDFVEVQSREFVYKYVMILVPVPATAGLNIPVAEFTPGPE